MVFLRAKLQWYRVLQIRVVKAFLRSFKNNWGLYLFGASSAAYFLYFRKRWAFVEPSKAEIEANPDKKLGRKTLIEVETHKIDQAFRKFLKYAMSQLLFSNSWIDELTGQALFDLTQVPSYQRLITDLFLLMY